LWHFPVCELAVFIPSSGLALHVQALQNEVAGCLQLNWLWGVSVPALIEFGTVDKGEVVVIGTQLIGGIQLGEGKLAFESSKCQSRSSPYSDLEGL
jgi:hypothetical protein